MFYMITWSRILVKTYWNILNAGSVLKRRSRYFVNYFRGISRQLTVNEVNLSGVG